MLRLTKAKPAGMLTVTVGPGQKRYHFSHAFINTCSSKLFQNAVNDGESIALHLPNLNALDLEDYVFYLTAKGLPLTPVTPLAIPKEYVAYERLIRLFNTGCELGDVQFQNACVDEALGRYARWNIFPAEQVLRELLKGTAMWNLIVDVYAAGWSFERFRDMREKVPMDFLWAVMERFMGVREVVEIGLGLEDACGYHLHDQLWPRSLCRRGAMEHERNPR